MGGQKSVITYNLATLLPVDGKISLGGGGGMVLAFGLSATLRHWDCI